MMLHTCDALVISCIDFRFQKYIRNWLDTQLAEKTFDYVGFAGGTKDLPTVLKQLELSVSLHHIKQVILMHHEDCGAYGSEGTLARHTVDLEKAKQTIEEKYPDLQVSMYFIHLDGTFEPISTKVFV